MMTKSKHLAIALILFPSIIIAQDSEELQRRIDVEIRGTHTLFAQLLQSEIEGEFESLGEVSLLFVHEDYRYVARSVIKTSKNLFLVKNNINAAYQRLFESDLMKSERASSWSDHPTLNQKWTYWIITDKSSGAKMYFEFIYSLPEKEVIISSYAYDFKSN